MVLLFLHTCLDTASLMQAARRGRPTKSASMDDEIDENPAGVSPSKLFCATKPSSLNF